MPTTDRDAAGLAYFAHRLRQETPGATTWDKPGIDAVVNRYVGKPLLSTLERVIRHAADPDARTPAAIDRPWTPQPAIPGPVMPPKVDEICHHCQRHLERCICDSAPQVRPRTASQRAVERAAELKRIKAAATAGFCSHGVAPDHCHETHAIEPTTEETP